MVSAGSYILSALALAAVVLSLGFSAVRLRRRLLPLWEGAPAVLVDAILAIALLIWLSQLLGLFSLLYASTLVAATLLLAAMIALGPRVLSRRPSPMCSDAAASSAMGDPRRRATHGTGDDVARGGWRRFGGPPRGSFSYRRGGGTRSVTGPAAPTAMSLVALAVVAIVVFHWATIAQHAVDRGIFNFDSLWYHMPFAVDMAQSHSVTGMHHVETVFVNWFYPQNSELIHAVGILLIGRDTLSLFLNFGWLAIAFLAAWCVGRPYGRGHLTLIAAAILLECHTLVVRDPGAAKNDLAAAALLLASIAILVEAWAHRTSLQQSAVQGGSAMRSKLEPRSDGWQAWALAAAGLAAGLAVGTRVTVLAMAAALSVAVLVLAPRGRRWAAAGWWFLPALAAGAFWYLRNLVVAGNLLPEIEQLGPISLPHPERLQEGRPDFAIAHYATDTGVWRHYFAPGLHEAFGILWPVVLLAAAAGALAAVFRGRDRLVRWLGGVALFGMAAYLFTPLSAAGVEGEPVGFGINIRYAVPALLGGMVLLPLPRLFDPPRRRWALLAALLLVFLVSDRPDAALHDQGRLFALGFVFLVLLIPAGLLYARSRGALRPPRVAAALALLGLAILAIGYPLQRHYLEQRFRNEVASEAIPGMGLDSAYRWARGIEDSRIGLAGTTAGFAGYGFYGADLSNEVLYLGVEGPHGAFNAIPTCAGFRAAINEAGLDYLVTAPFLSFLHPNSPVASPEARWLRGARAVRPLLRSGPVTVWALRGKLEPSDCAAANEPLREVPETPAG